MGCDIHFYVEQKKKSGSWELVTPRLIERRTLRLGAWKGLSTKEFNKAYSGLLLTRLHAGGRHAGDATGDWMNQYEHEQAQKSFYTDGRNYTLFAILANVRNYEDSKVVVLAEPRGIPKDASKGYSKIVTDYGEDGHSHSWFTLAELQAYVWEDTPCADFSVTLARMATVGKPHEVRACFHFDN